jgi:hypothetical protein
VPTPLMRQGNFSELLNPALNGAAVQLYEPNSGSGGPAEQLVCNGQNNVVCASQIDPVAQNLLNLYPLPNANGWTPGLTTNNYKLNNATSNNTIQWDQRIDWNVSKSDQAYARYSYNHVINFTAPPLGPVLDGRWRLRL